MTKIAIQPSGSGTGTFTIAAPNSNTNRTFTLPDETGEIITTSGLADAIPEFAPNAVIVESDSNANGRFVKYSDGTLIIHAVIAENRSSSGLVVTTFTWPTPFVDKGFVPPDGTAEIATVISGLRSNAIVADIEVRFGNIGETSVDIRVIRSDSVSSVVHLQAIGYWK